MFIGRDEVSVTICLNDSAVRIFGDDGRHVITEGELHKKCADPLFVIDCNWELEMLNY